MWHICGVLAWQVEHMHTAAALAWHPDGTRLWVGTAAGSLEAYQTCSSCRLYGQSLQVEQHANGQATVASLKDGAFVLQSGSCYTILAGLLLGDLASMPALLKRCMLATVDLHL